MFFMDNKILYFKDIEMNLTDGTNDSIVAKGTKNLIENLTNILTELKTKELDRE